MAEGVVDLHVLRDPVLVEGVDPVFGSLAEKTEDLAVVFEDGVIEVTEDEFLRRRIHRLVVVAEEPFLELGLVAGLAAFVSDVGGSRDGVPWGRGGAFLRIRRRLTSARGENEGGAEEDRDASLHGTGRGWEDCQDGARSREAGTAGNGSISRNGAAAHRFPGPGGPKTVLPARKTGSGRFGTRHSAPGLL